ncbi:cap-specific mRNA (nucleoside-2'-O-)-methyltransferase 1 [Hydra vulgaris]|uniref:Cap-specific mRNA (nucleoside-2'-O-)-methyltransferase 1 n=1 Tax=Hydra vulgaris TaxID=6087 RepID=A0ABM4BKY3_HYDVU
MTISYLRYSLFTKMERKRKHSFDNEPSEKKFKEDDHPDNFGSSYSSAAQRMMSKMGYAKGKGLGKNETGRVNIIEASNQRGRRGLGLKLDGLDAKPDASWEVEEEIMVRQEPDWVPKSELDMPNASEMRNWMIEADRKEFITDEYEFCEPDILDGIIKNKNVFDKLGQKEFLHARTRANPYETIRGAIFQNRAAMKMAEIDASFNYMFTNHIERDLNNPLDLLYFADICAGPGGFSEYVFWRSKWRAKGFGMTIKAEWANDFNLADYIAGTPESFDCFYGEGGYNGDGDIFKKENLIAFRKYVLENSDNKGLHFVMADGGFSVEGQENIQEILSKQLYLCQFLCALSVLRKGGHFICKVFDLFTPFSIGLVYLMYRAFDQICIFKPVTSRPANSERYLICKDLRENSGAIHDYMFNINNQINNLKRTKRDIQEIVPLSIIKESKEFFHYMFTSNNSIGARQILGLQKVARFVQNTNLTGPDHAVVRKQCLEAWKIPLIARSSPPKNDPDVQFEKLMKDSSTEWMSKNSEFFDLKALKRIKSVYDYKFTVSGGKRVFLFSLGRHNIFKWDPAEHSYPDWKRADKMNLELPRFTLIDVELLNEFKGDGRGQRKMFAVHILDAVYLGDEYVGDKAFSDRIKCCESFVKALSKPCRNDIVPIQIKSYYALTDLEKTFKSMEIRHMKPHLIKRLTYNVSSEKYFVPTGLYLVERLQEPWHLQKTRSSNKFYFYNAETKESVFEGTKDSIANVKYCISRRMLWKWDEHMGLDLLATKGDEVSIAGFYAFINEKS